MVEWRRIKYSGDKARIEIAARRVRLASLSWSQQVSARCHEPFSRRLVQDVRRGIAGSLCRSPPTIRGKEVRAIHIGRVWRGSRLKCSSVARAGHRAQHGHRRLRGNCPRGSGIARDTSVRFRRLRASINEHEPAGRRFVTNPEQVLDGWITQKRLGV